MVIYYKDKKFNFIEIFNPNNGLLIRSNTSVPPYPDAKQRSFPELIDIGIMGKCHIAHLGICRKAGIDCYQNAPMSSRDNMSLETYTEIINQCYGRVFQVALGGSGDPNKHENFKEILEITRKKGIVPNLTTSGMFLTDEEVADMKKYCGAVAVSFYSKIIHIDGKYMESNPSTINAIQKLIKAGCVTNVHYVLSTDTINEAIIRIEKSLFPIGINAVIFLLYKPVGLGKYEKTLSVKNNSFKKLLRLVNTLKNTFKIGFDTCCTPALLCECHNISETSIDFCEAARFSMYISSESKAYPCSFDTQSNMFMEDLSKKTIKEAWDSENFNKFRKIQNEACPNCNKREICLGGCSLKFNLNVCGEKQEE